MRRLHLLEIHDQPWCPRALRNGVTDILQLTATTLGAYRPILAKLARAAERTGQTRIVDLCAGGGGPWRSLLPDLPAGIESVLLTDFFPNLPAFERATEKSRGRVRFHAESVDATAVPPGLTGLRTVFTAFHHFRPEEARAILADAVDKGVGIGVFELTERKASMVIMVLLGVPFAAIGLTPLARPFSWSRLVFTYAVPLIPLLLAVDGVVSCLRTYSPEELEELVASLDAPHYDWEIGVERETTLLPITYLVGTPRPAG